MKYLILAIFITSYSAKAELAEPQSSPEGSTAYKHMVCQETNSLIKKIKSLGLTEQWIKLGSDGLGNKFIYQMFSNQFDDWVILLSNTNKESCILGQSLTGPSGNNQL